MDTGGPERAKCGKTGKLCFSVAEADAKVKEINGPNRARYKHYKCPTCGAQHLAHASPRNKRRIRRILSVTTQ